MSNDQLEKLSEAFSEYMTPDEDGEPLLFIPDLKHALIHAEIPTSLIPQIEPLMDPEHTGRITFEKFISVCQEITAEEGEIEENEGEAEEDEEDFGGGFDPDDIEDDESEDEDYKDENIENEASGGNLSNTDRVFNLLSQGNDRITPESLAQVGKLINLHVDPADLQKMVAKASSKQEFRRLWRQLE